MMYGQEIPFVDEFTYLGVIFSSDSTVKREEGERCKKVVRSGGAILRILRDRQLSVSLRATILKQTAQAAGVWGHMAWMRRQEDGWHLDMALAKLCGAMHGLYVRSRDVAMMLLRSMAYLRRTKQRDSAN